MLALVSSERVSDSLNSRIYPEVSLLSADFVASGDDPTVARSGTPPPIEGHLDD
jgi:hypothetical protein